MKSRGENSRCKHLAAEQVLEPSSGRLNWTELRARSHDMELLIALAVIFSLYQADQALLSLAFRARLSLDAGWNELIEIFSIYTRMATIALLVLLAFSVLVRMLWIAKIGVHAVFPAGPRYRQDSAASRLKQQLLADIDPHDSLVRMDQLATSYFALGCIVAVGFLMANVVVFGAALLAFGLHHLLPSGIVQPGQWRNIGLAGLCVFILPQLLLAIYVRKVGKYSDKTLYWSRRATELYGLLPRAIFTHPQLTVSSNAGSFKGKLLLLMPFLLGLLYLYASVFYTTRYANASPYGDQNIDALTAVPRLASAVASEASVMLFLPMVPSKVADILDKDCPKSFATLDADGKDWPAARQQREACWRALWTLEINGLPVPLEQFVAQGASWQNQPGLRGALDLRALTPGLQYLSVRRKKPTSPSDARTEERWEIPFWYQPQGAR